jgi:Xaa-Pro aminopeptidase
MEAMRNYLRKGIREDEVAAEVASVLSREQVEALLFLFIMVSGPRTAYPHGSITD